MTKFPIFNGFTLIEVLISMLLLSVGVIGVVKMQLLSMQSSQQSLFYSTAVELSTDIAEKIRNHHQQMRSADVNPPLNVDFHSNPKSMSDITQCASADCSQAQEDISEWLHRISTLLPNARAVICRDSSPWNNDIQSLVWDCDATEGASIIIKIGWSDQQDTLDTPPPKLATALTY